MKVPDYHSSATKASSATAQQVGGLLDVFFLYYSGIMYKFLRSKQVP